MATACHRIREESYEPELPRTKKVYARLDDDNVAAQT
jgi:hypothetical protein